MFKKLTALMVILLLLLSVGCGGDKSSSDGVSDASSVTSSVVSQTPSEPEVIKTPDMLNPLTGVYEYQGIDKLRPVAVMINNDRRAQDAQAGLPEADIIYETEIEGGETRLMAVFKDVEKVQNIGTVRSSRYVYIDLAMGHGAVYIHHGADEVNARPHLKHVDSFDIHEGLYGDRIKNGLAWEHTLYTHGPKLWAGIDKKFETELETVTPWQKFAAEDEKVTLPDGTATKISVPYSGNYFKSVFIYDSATGLYERNFKDKIPTEYYTKESTKVKNVVVCMTSIVDYPEGEHRKISLSGGDGYYFTNGTYQAIKWSKGDSNDPMKFTDKDGNPITFSAGNTWVCIASKSYSKPVIE